MKGKKIIENALVMMIKEDTVKGLDGINLSMHSQLLELHARALACHCECLGMNAENCQRAMLGQSPAYSDDSYLVCMTKWGLMNEKGEPTI